MFEKIHETFSIVHDYRHSNDCSIFNELANTLQDCRVDLKDHIKFSKNIKKIYEINSLLFHQKSFNVRSMNKLSAIKLGGYQNFTTFLQRDIDAAISLKLYTEQKELSFRYKSCFNCKKSKFFNPAFCVPGNFKITTPTHNDLSEEYIKYLKALDTRMNLVASEIPIIFKNFEKCNYRNLTPNCTITIQQSLESLDHYLNLVQRLQNIYDLKVLYFLSFSNNSITDSFVSTQIYGNGGRSDFLQAEYNYLKRVFEKFSNILHGV